MTTSPPTSATELSDAKRDLLRRWMRGGAGARPSSDAIERRAPGADAPLSYAQLRLWFLGQLVPGSPAYNIPIALRLRGPLDRTVLEHALSGVAARHEALRTVFPMVGDEPVQRVLAPEPVRLDAVSLTELGPAARDAALAAEVAAEARRPFDAATERPMRARLLRLGDDDHALLLTWSHLVADGWSAAVFSHELAALYRARLAGRPDGLAPPAVQYGDFAAWQRGWLKGERLETQLSWWREALAGADGVVDLPADRPRPAIQSFHGDALHLTLPRDLTAGLHALARSCDATLFQVLLAAFKTLLLRFSGQPDLLVGTPVANRRRSDLEQAIGFFANTLVLRTDLAGDPTFREAVGRVRASALGAFAHQDLPFERLVDELVPERSLSHNPLFQTMFVLSNVPPAETELAPGLTMERIESHAGSAKFDLWLSMQEMGDDLVGVLEYSTDLFERATAEAMLRHFEALLRAAVSDPDRPLSRLVRLEGDERARVVERPNATAKAYAGGQTLPQLVEAQVDRTPDAPALRFEGETLTYAEVDARANRVAHRLRAAGAGRGTLVAICAERSFELVCGLLGIAKAGAAYVPVDPDHPADRVRYLLADSGAGVLLTQRRLHDRLPRFAGTVLALDDDATAGDAQMRRPGDGPGPDDLAYVIYTSGSTGRPKGAMNEHRGIANRLLWMQDRFGIGPGDRVVQKTPSSFDVSVWEFFWPLMTGAELVVARPDGHRDPAYLAELLARERITTAHFVPSMLRLFLDENDDLSGCGALRRVICSGEALPVELERRFFARLGCELHNLYGPTEAAVDVTSWQCEPDGDRATVPIGRPIANTTTYVLDAALEPVPVGVPGELHLGGVAVGRGYHRRPALTAERFVPDPFGAPGARLYRTGDLARWTADGTLEYLGRADQQVKVGGIRIEPGEVEAALRGVDGVRDAAVAVRALDGRDALVAYVVPGTEDEVRRDGGELVRRWADVFDDAYAPTAGAAGEFDTAGWNSSLTGAPLDEAEMRAWLDQTVGRIRALRPRRVLEVGVGTGLLLFPLVRDVERYHGVDVSATGLEGIRRVLAARDVEADVVLEQRAAHEIGALEPGSFDCVVLNSVAQYFPDVAYLLDVLAQAARLCADGGAIFLGDVRVRRLAEVLAASVELHQAGDDVPAGTVARRIEARVAHETELLAEPELFAALPGRVPRIAAARAELKGEGYDNELSRYRCDVVLTVGAHADASADRAADGDGAETVDWDAAGLDIDTLVERLIDEPVDALILRDVPDARHERELRMLAALRRPGVRESATARDLRAAAASGDGAPAGVAPERLRAMVGSLGYEATLHPAASGAAGRFDAAVFRPGHGAGLPPVPPPDGPLERLANRPLDRRRLAELAPRWRDALKETLPEYLIPAEFVLLDELPLTPSGKLARDRLPAPPPRLPDTGAAHVPPATPQERTLAAIWAEVLGVERVGRDDNLFALGGDSIRGIQIIARAKRAGLALAPRDLFRHPTVAELARVATEQAEAPATGESAAPEAGGDAGGADGAALAALRAEPEVEAVAPVTGYQRHMLYAHRTARRVPGQFLVQRAEYLRGDVDLGALGRAWRRLPALFPILRTSLRADGLDAPVQVVHRTAQLPLAIEDWQPLADAERERRLAAHLRADRERGCDPGVPAGLRLLAARTADDTVLMVVSFGYPHVDGWTLALVTQALLALHDAERDGTTAEVDGGPPFARYAAWTRRADAGAGSERFWRAALAGAEPTPLVAAVQPEAPRGRAGLARVHLYLDAATTTAVRDAARRQQVTASALVQAAWALVLSARTGRDDVVFGAFLNGRSAEMPGIERLAGPTMSVLPVRAAGLADLRTVAALTRELLDVAAEVVPHEQVDPDRLADWCGDGGRFESYLVFQNLDSASFDSVQRITPFFSHMGHPVRIDVFPAVELGLALSYERAALGDEAAAGLLADLATALAAIAEGAATLADVRAAVAARPGRPPRWRTARIVEDGIRMADVETVDLAGQVRQ